MSRSISSSMLKGAVTVVGIALLSSGVDSPVGTKVGAVCEEVCVLTRCQGRSKRSAKKALNVSEGPVDEVDSPAVVENLAIYLIWEPFIGAKTDPSLPLMRYDRFGGRGRHQLESEKKEDGRREDRRREDK